MFLKSIKQRLKKGSIAGQLSVLYTLTTLILLTLFAFYSYWALVSILSNANEQFLQDEIRVLRNIMQKHPTNMRALQQEVDWIPEELESSEYHYYARILNEEKKPIIATEGMSSVLKEATFPDPVNIKQIPENSVRWTSPSNKTYLLMSAWSKLGNSSERSRLIEIALDISPQYKIISQYRNNLLLVCVIGLLFAALLGVFVARKGMRGLKDITNAAENINITQLNKIDVEHCPKELHTLANAFNQMLNRIEDAFKRLSQFSAELAHEFRTPINNLMGEAEIALSKARTAEEYQTVLVSSLEEYSRLSRMIESILFLARTENFQSSLKLSEINIVDEFQKIVEFYEMAAVEKNIRIRVNGNANIRADSQLLRRALSNILSNALRYTPSGGTILLSTGYDTDNAYISVSDNGIGISGEHLTHVFDRFYRVETDKQTTSYNVGLGLAIVKSIMELHKGRINISSQPNHGTTIELFFPL